jgi:hypothetical protein
MTKIYDQNTWTGHRVMMFLQVSYQNRFREVRKLLRLFAVILILLGLATSAFGQGVRTQAEFNAALANGGTINLEGPFSLQNNPAYILKSGATKVILNGYTLESPGTITFTGDQSYLTIVGSTLATNGGMKLKGGLTLNYNVTGCFTDNVISRRDVSADVGQLEITFQLHAAIGRQGASHNGEVRLSPCKSYGAGGLQGITVEYHFCGTGF